MGDEVWTLTLEERNWRDETARLIYARMRDKSGPQAQRAFEDADKLLAYRKVVHSLEEPSLPSLVDLKLPSRPMTVLVNHGYTTVERLLEAAPEDIYSLPQMGPNSFAALCMALARYDLALKGDDPKAWR